MKRPFLLFSYIVFFILISFVVGSRAYADDTSQFNAQIRAVHVNRALTEAQLGLDPQFNRIPQATCYYDDLADHDEQVFMMSDFIDQGIR